MKKLKLLKPLFYIICLACLLNSCQKEIFPEIIGVSNELTAYERYVQDFNSGRIDSSAFILTKDGGGIYYSYSNKVIVGDTIPFVSLEISICKLDKSYNLVWKYTYGDFDEITEIGRLIQIDDGSILFMASKYHLPSNNNSPNFVHSLVKLSKNGEFLWEKEIDNVYSSYSLYQTADEGFVIAGMAQSVYSYTLFESTEIPNHDWFITKTDKSGSIVWSKTYGEADTYISPSSIIQTEDKGYLATLYSLNRSSREERNRIVKFDQFGNIIKSVDLPSISLGRTDVIFANDDGFVFAGANPTFDVPKLNLFKINNSGNIVWSKEYSKADKGFIKDLRIMKLFNSGYFIIIHSFDFSDVNSTVLPIKSSIIKVNNSGDLIE